MRSLIILSLAAIGLAAPAYAQVDRYGGYANYPAATPMQPAPMQPARQVQAPERVLTWPGKTIPAAPPAAPPGYVYPPYMASQQQPGYSAGLQQPPYARDRSAPPTPYELQRGAAYPVMAPAAYGPPRGPMPQQPAPQPQQPQAQAAQMAPPMRPVVGYASPYQPQPYYAPAPAAPAPAPDSTATAPTGVYPANTVPPQIAYPAAVPPQMAAPLVGPPQAQRQQALPTSIYAPPAQAQVAPPAAEELNGSQGLSQARPNPTDPRQPQRVAMNTTTPNAQTQARLYSLHREFGLTPDPTPAAAPEGQVVQLVSPIDSGNISQADTDNADRPATRRVTDSSGKTVTAQLRGQAAAGDD